MQKRQLNPVFGRTQTKLLASIVLCWSIVSIVSIGCHPVQPPSKKPVVPTVIGRWQIDNAETVKQSMTWLAAEGVKRRDSDKFVRDLYGEMHMFYEFYSDGTFLCHQSNAKMDSNFTGTWTLDGVRVIASQTHADDEPWEDEMFGKLEGDSLKLCHQQPIGLVRIIMHRVEENSDVK